MSEAMVVLAQTIDDFLNGSVREREGRPSQIGFCLTVFPLNGGPSNFISNTEHREVVTRLKEQLACFERQTGVMGTA